MKQIVDKLNKIAKKIDESVEIPQTDLIIDSLDAITKAYGGTPNDSNLIVDKLDDIYNNIGPAVSGNIEITENGENINVAPYATATVNVSGGGGDLKTVHITINATGVNQTTSIQVLNIVDGLVTRGAGADISSPVEITALIEKQPVLPDGFEYSVSLDMTTSPGSFTSDNTGTNCQINFDSDYPNELTIVVDDLDTPASAVINVTTGGVG